MGVAAVSVPRFERAVERFGERLLGRLFLRGELEYARRRRNGTESLAARLAAKWAAREALLPMGLGRVPARQLEVVRRRGEAPTLRAHGSVERAVEGLWFSVSLTHDREIAMATVWLERWHASLSRP